MKKIILLMIMVMPLLLTLSGCKSKTSDNDCCECKDCPECDACCSCEHPYMNK